MKHFQKNTSHTSLATLRREKMTDNHSTITEASSEIVDEAIKLDIVTKVSLGIIKYVPGNRRALKFLPITGGFKAVVRGSGAVQEVFIYTKEPLATQELLTRSFFA